MKIPCKQNNFQNLLDITISYFEKRNTNIDLIDCDQDNNNIHHYFFEKKFKWWVMNYFTIQSITLSSDANKIIIKTTLFKSIFHTKFLLKQKNFFTKNHQTLAFRNSLITS